MKKLFSLVILTMLYTSALAGHVTDEGTHEGVHWQIYYNDKGDERLIIDGKTILSYHDLISKRDIFGKLYFETADKNTEGHYDYELYSIKGDKVFSYSSFYGAYKKDGFEYVLLGRNKKTEMYSRDLKLLYSDLAFGPEIRTINGIDGKFLEVTLKIGDSFVHDLYTNDWKLLVPRYRYFDLSSSGDYYIFSCPNGFDCRLDKSLHWIGPSPTVAQQFEKVEQFITSNYFKCKKGGYWGLYDSNFKEIIAPDYEELGYFDNTTNYIKFKLNSFWGVMTLQNNTAKEIISTTRGYTSIDRYIKSQKRFTYAMYGYKGECDATTGRQLSKIKVETPQQAVASSSSSSSSSSSASSNSNSGNSNSGTTTVVVEHHRDPVPVQQWQACFACGGMGTMGCDNCGGGGTKYIGDRLHRCSRCNGRGIIPCNVCYGSKGKYITVYQ